MGDTQTQYGSGRGAGKVLTPRRAATRAKLVSAARELIAKRGVAATSVEEISEHAGFTRGAFYSNFDDIYDILTTVAAEEYERLQTSLHAAWEQIAPQIAASKKSGKEALPEIVEQLLAIIPVGKDFCLIQSELAMQMIRNPNLYAKLSAPRELFHQELTDFLVHSLRVLGLEVRGEPRAVTEAVVALLRHVSEVSLTSGRTKRLVDPSEHARTLIPALIGAVTVVPS